MVSMRLVGTGFLIKGGGKIVMWGELRGLYNVTIAICQCPYNT